MSFLRVPTYGDHGSDSFHASFYNSKRCLPGYPGTGYPGHSEKIWKRGAAFLLCKALASEIALKVGKRNEIRVKKTRRVFEMAGGGLCFGLYPGMHINFAKSTTQLLCHFSNFTSYPGTTATKDKSKMQMISHGEVKSDRGKIFDRAQL
eukprot:1827371-Rhodomonas_salina.3